MGNLTNQYVSQSYQGLLKLDNSNTGVTATLQYVTDGLGNKIPMQVSTSSVVITGSFRGDGSGLTGITVDSGSLVTTSSFNAYTSSNDSKVNSLIAGTGSYATTSSLTALSQSIASTDLSQNNRLTAIEGVTGSFASTASLNSYTLTSSFNSYTSSANGRLNSLESATGSLQNQINQKLDTGSFNSYTSSNDGKVNSLIAATASYVTETESGSFLITGSASGNVLTFTKGNGTQFNLSVDTGSNSNRNGLITTGSIGGNQSITGSLNVQGTISATSASFTYITTVYETASVIYSSGSNQLGDASDDTQTLWGTVVLPSGPLDITGSLRTSGQIRTDNNLVVIGNIQTNNIINPGSAGDITINPSGLFKVVIDGDTEITGTLKVTGGITGSLQGTASYATQALSASFASNALSTSFAQTSISSSFSSFAVSSSQAQNAVSASQAQNAVSASQSQNANLLNGTGSGVFATTGSNMFTGQQTINNAAGFIVNDPTFTAYAGIDFFTGGTGTQATFTSTADRTFINGKNDLYINSNVGGATTGSIYVTSNKDFQLNAISGVTSVSSSLVRIVSPVIVTGSLILSGSVGPELDVKGDVIITGSVIMSGSAGVELDVKGDTTVTGSVNILGSLNLRGNETISGSLITNTLNDGLIKILTEAQNSSSLAVPFGYISASAAVSQSNLIFGLAVSGPGPGQLPNTFTGSIVISGSNNIILQGNRTNTLVTAGTYGYIGANNFVSAIPTITTSSILRPTLQNNNLNSQVTFAFTTSSLTGPGFATNNVLNSVTINHQSGSINYLNNINVGPVTSTANNITLPFLPTIQQNYFGSAQTTLNHISSSITTTNNIIGGGAFTVTNLVSSSVSPTNNGLTLGSNLIVGQANGVWVSGSNTTNRRNITSNIIGGVNTAISSSQIGADTHLFGAIVYGQNLIVSASHALNNGGSAFFGRFNDTGSLALAQDIVFGVGTGTAVSTRRTGLWITSGSLVGVSGSMAVTGALSITGSDVNIKGISQETGSFFVTMDSTGSLHYATPAQALPSLFAAGGFYDTGSYTTTANVSSSFVYFSSIGVNDTITVVSGSRLYVPRTATYNIQYSTQISQGASEGNVAVWLKKNGVNVADTATYVTIPSNHKDVLALNLWDNATSGSYYELAYQSDSNNTTFETVAASGNIPRSPSIIVTINQIR